MIAKKLLMNYEPTPISYPHINPWTLPEFHSLMLQSTNSCKRATKFSSVVSLPIGPEMPYPALTNVRTVSQQSSSWNIKLDHSKKYNASLFSHWRITVEIHPSPPLALTQLLSLAWDELSPLTCSTISSRKTSSALMFVASRARVHGYITPVCLSLSYPSNQYILRIAHLMIQWTPLFEPAAANLYPIATPMLETFLVSLTLFCSHQTKVEQRRPFCVTINTKQDDCGCARSLYR